MINLFCLFFLVWPYFRRKRAGGILFQIWRHFLLQSTSPYFTKVKPDVRDNLDASSRLLATMNMLSKFDRPCLVLNSIGQLCTKYCGLQAHQGRSSLHAMQGAIFELCQGGEIRILYLSLYPLFVFVVKNDSAGSLSTVQDSSRTSLGSQ